MICSWNQPKSKDKENKLMIKESNEMGWQSGLIRFITFEQGMMSLHDQSILLPKGLNPRSSSQRDEHRKKCQKAKLL